MKCEDAIDVIHSTAANNMLRQQAALAHVEACASCTAAARALTTLRNEQLLAVPELPRGSFERALERAVAGPRAAETRARGRGFWLGTAVGGAVAAGLALAVALLWPQTPAPVGNPFVELAANEVRAVDVSLDSPEALAGAEIRVELTGSVGLEGFADRRELRWVTDLDRGVNQLTLPLVGLDAGGGQVTVEVHHGTRQRTFVIDVRTTDARPDDAV